MDYIDDSFQAPKLIEGEDYYMDPRGFRVMTEKYNRKRGYCCGSGCKHCAYFPPHIKGNTTLKNS